MAHKKNQPAGKSAQNAKAGKKDDDARTQNNMGNMGNPGTKNEQGGMKDQPATPNRKGSQPSGSSR